ncbi:hypothetical protein JCM10212_005932 [Sporobolomyces blumeae]
MPPPPADLGLPTPASPPASGTLQDQQRDPPPATIRAYDAKTDLKLTRYLIGAGVMEPSSLANRAALFKPLSLVSACALSHVLISRFTAGYPPYLHNLVSSNPKPYNDLAPIWQSIADTLLLVPLFLGPTIMILAMFEMRHRALFETEMRRAIGEEDLRDITKYYGVKKVGEQAKIDTQKQPEQRKGFWVLEYDDRILGVVGIDGTRPGQPLDSIMDHVDAARAKRTAKDKVEDESIATQDSAESTATPSKSTTSTRARAPKSLDVAAQASAPSLSVTPPSPASGTAPSSYALASSPLPDGTLHLRRFTTSMSFRSADIEDDLLEHAAKEAFATRESDSSSPPPARQLVVALRPTVQKELKSRLEKHGWALVPQGSELEVPLSGQKTSTSPKSAISKALDVVWPLSLQPRTMVLKRSVWEARQRSDAATAVSSLFGGKNVKVSGPGL